MKQASNAHTDPSAAPPGAMQSRPPQTRPREWEARLNREWPQRIEVAAWIAAQIAQGGGTAPKVVELACGAGYLAASLVRHIPDLRYCGFDLSPHLLEFARQRLPSPADRPEGQAEMHFHQADLLLHDWVDRLLRMGWAGRIDAVVSIQALHDLGGREQQTAVLAQARELLRPGGQLAYGDLLLDNENPHSRRFSAAQHEEMLGAAGFSQSDALQPADSAQPPHGNAAGFACLGEFGCFRRYR